MIAEEFCKRISGSSSHLFAKQQLGYDTMVTGVRPHQRHLLLVILRIYLAMISKRTNTTPFQAF